MPHDCTTSPESGKSNRYPGFASGGIVEMALAVAERWPVFPCKANKKPTTLHGFKEATRAPAAIRKAFRDPRAALIGVPTGAATGFDVLDVDPRHGGDKWREANISRLPETRVHQTPGLPKVPADPVMPGEHWLFVHTDGVKNQQDGKSIAPGIDVRGTGGYVVVPPSNGYRIINEAEIAPWPDWLLPLVVKAPKPFVRPIITPRPPPSDQLEKRYRAFIDALLAKVQAAPEGAKHDTLLKMARSFGGVMRVVNIRETEAVDMLLAALPATVTGEGLVGARRTAIDGLRHGAAEPITLEDRPGPGRRGNGPPPPPPPDEDPRPDVPPPDPDPGPGMDDLGLVTEDSVAIAFADLHKNDLRFDHDAGAWFRWTGVAWRREVTKLAYSYARKLARQLSAASENFKAQLVAGKASFAAGVERFAQSDRCFAVTNEVWDQDPYLLGTPDGTMDLRTGKLRPASQSDCITKLTSVGPSEKVDCPIWLAFLNQATRDDPELVAFLKRWFGYCLTGDTREHKLVFAWGPGGNGKGVLMNTIGAIFGDYCKTAAMDSFVVTRGDKHTTDMAMLAGARLVMTTEIEEGHVWAQAKVNQLTGGDPITARFMRRDNFTYIPQFKLSISGNNKPRLNNVDDAARRRINMVPFENKPAKPDDTLKERLRAEHPAILRWMTNGCLEWQKGGLQPPKSVQAATDEYFDAQDYFGRWLDECCIVDPTLETKPSVALKSFQEWCAQNGEAIVDSRRFHGLVEKAAGLRSMFSDGVRVVRGLGLKPPPRDDRYGKDT